MRIVDSPYVYGWQSHDEIDGLAKFEDTTVLTATIVTIIDTALDVTSTITRGYTPSQTNAAGTRIETIFYTKMGQALSTIL